MLTYGAGGGAALPRTNPGAGSLAGAVSRLTGALPRRAGTASQPFVPRLDEVGALLDLYREWYPFSVRFLAAAGRDEASVDASIALPLGLWYELVRPEVASTPTVAERVAVRLIGLARRTEAAAHAEAWAAVESGAEPAEVGLEPVAHFLRLATGAGGSQLIVRLAFAQPLAAVFATAAAGEAGAAELIAASGRWSGSVRLGGRSGRLADCVRPFAQVLRRRAGEGPNRGVPAVPALTGFGRRGL